MAPIIVLQVPQTAIELYVAQKGSAVAVDLAPLQAISKGNCRVKVKCILRFCI
jgi:hypothetical protein